MFALIINLISFIIKHWYIWVIGGLLIFGAIHRQELQNYAMRLYQSELNVKTATDANATNMKTIQSLQQDIANERQAIQEQQDRSNELSNELDTIRKEMKDVPGANDPLPPYLNTLLDRLCARTPSCHIDSGH